MQPFDLRPRTRVVFGPGSLQGLPELARELGFRRTLLCADPGLVAAGHAGRARELLAGAGVHVVPFHAFGEDPDSDAVAAGAELARAEGIDSLVGLGGGSSMDCAKAIGFLLANGGVIRDYRGYGKAARPLPPMIGIPTTAGSGSEAQSYALISDAGTREKLACGDPTAAFRVAILDPDLLLTQPRSSAAVSGFDAISHAVETWVTTRRNPHSEMLSREAWRRLTSSYERVLGDPADPEARASMQLGAFYAGAAIEASMLGAAHACANPISAGFGTVHGIAVSLMLPSVVRWNTPAAAERYGELLALVTAGAPVSDPAAALADRLEALAVAGGLPRGLAAVGVSAGAVDALASQAAEQWTGRFNPRPFDLAGARELYRMAY
jgi:alcohol dehydrogenase